MSVVHGFHGPGADFLSSNFTFLLTLAVVLLAWLLYLYVVDSSRYPGGPLRLPAIGNTLQLLWHGGILEFITKSWRRYGDIFTIQIGSKMFVVLNGYETIDDALVKKSESFSEHNVVVNVRGVPHSEGILFSPYPAWKDHRKVALKSFKHLGYARQDLEEKVNQEIAKVIEEISVTAQLPFAIDDILHKATSNVMSSMVFGSRFEYNDKDFVELLDKIKNIMIEGRTAAIYHMFPMLRYSPIGLIKTRRVAEQSVHFVAFMEKKVLEIERNLESAPPSFIKAYLEEMQEKNSKSSSLTRRRCVDTVGDLFGAGSETTATALEWAFLHCIMHPDMQRRTHSEIDHVLGQRAAALADRQKMPFVNAFLTEVLRFGNVAALALPHRAVHDVVLNGKFIPKGTEIIINLHSILHDERIFEEPLTFRPDRFLEHDGKFSQPTKLIPFGLGQRVCVGEDLAQTELFLFFTAILQRFTLLPAPGANLSAKALFGITRRPMPYKLVALPR